jgi:hypothetical protein
MRRVVATESWRGCSLDASGVTGQREAARTPVGGAGRSVASRQHERICAGCAPSGRRKSRTGSPMPGPTGRHGHPRILAISAAASPYVDLKKPSAEWERKAGPSTLVTVDLCWPGTPERVASRRTGMISKPEAGDRLVIALLWLLDRLAAVDLRRRQRSLAPSHREQRWPAARPARRQAPLRAT